MGEKIQKDRLDVILVQRGLAESRQQARALIMAGSVLVNGDRVDKPGKLIPVTVNLALKERLPYVSRGGLKLEGALDKFNIEPHGLTILDAGASTGGFTDCLLQRGAVRVIALDVGYGQLHWKLLRDSRVIVLDRTNIRHLDTDTLPCTVQAIVADLSFISLKLVLFKFMEILTAGGWALVLVKPQFEVGKAEIAKGGIVRNQTSAKKAVASVRSYAEEIGFFTIGEMESPITGAKGNREFFLYLAKE